MTVLFSMALLPVPSSDCMSDMAESTWKGVWSGESLRASCCVMVWRGMMRRSFHNPGPSCMPKQDPKSKPIMGVTKNEGPSLESF